MLTYAVVTPVWNEVENLERVAACLRAQTIRPAEWVIVETGSTDGTLELARELSATDDWIRRLETDQPAARGGPIVRAFELGVHNLNADHDVIVKLDADVSFEAKYFSELLRRFEEDSALGIASGTCYEHVGGTWRERHVTGDHVWGASRAYRASCLAQVSPLEQRMGWDGIDAFKAQARGWRTATIRALPFRHHRTEGAREQNRWSHWKVRGRAAHYMGYRPSFVVARAARHMGRDPAALGLIHGWAAAALRREATCGDSEAVEALRDHQRLRVLGRRALEAYGKR